MIETVMQEELSNLLTVMSKRDYVSASMLQEFQDFIYTHNHFVKTTSPRSHICTFFLPFNQTEKKVFLGHHIKSDKWIPPGGHVEVNETTIDSTIRETYEELDMIITDKDLVLFDISITNIDLPHYPCKKHYDIWYLLRTEKTDISGTNTEFHDSKWLNTEEALEKMSIKGQEGQLDVMKKLAHVDVVAL